MNRDQFTDGHRRDVCCIGQGNACCRYLTMDAKGWGCEKHSSLKSVLDAKVARKEMVARGDNCEGLLAECLLSDMHHRLWAGERCPECGYDPRDT